MNNLLIAMDSIDKRIAREEEQDEPSHSTLHDLFRQKSNLLVMICAHSGISLTSQPEAAAPAKPTNERLGELTRRYTAFVNFSALVHAPGRYFPTFRCKSARSSLGRAELTELADAYDAAQEARGDKRRTHRT